MNVFHGITDREKSSRLLLFGPHLPLPLSPGTERFQLDSFGGRRGEKEGDLDGIDGARRALRPVQL